MGRRRQTQNRVRIMEGARVLLDSGRYKDLTVDALSRELRMSKTTLYKYYRDKADLVTTMVEQSCRVTDDEIQAHGEAMGDMPPARAIAAILTVYGAHGQRLPRAVVLEPEKLPAPARRRLASVRTRLEGAIEDAVALGATARVLRTQKPSLARTALVASAAAAVEAGARGELDASVEDLVQLVV